MAFHPIDRDTDYLLPPSEWLPEVHLARYVVDVVEGLDLSALERAYAGRGSPATLLSLLIYGYATGTLFSRKIARAIFDSLAFRYIACNRHPDHDTLATFRKRFGKEFQSAFVQVLQVARENQLTRFGTASLGGTEIHANASRHSALSYGHASMIETHLKVEVQELLALAEAADQSAVPDGVNLPDEIKRREDRLAAIATAKAKIEARAKECHEQEQAEYRAKMAARAAKEAATGKKSGGKPPAPPATGPCADDQINLTDEESRIMKVAGGGFEQCYNAQAVVDTGPINPRSPRRPGDQRQGTGRADGREGASQSRRAESTGDPPGGYGLLQPEERHGLQRRQDHVADCSQARCAPSSVAGALHRAGAAGWRRFTCRCDEACAQPRPVARPMRCASKPWNRCSASSSR